MPYLTEEQQRELDAARNGHAHLIDPRDNSEYVIVPLEVYQRLEKSLISDPSDAYPLVDESFRDGWSDPKMADYGDYESNQRK